MSNLTSFLSRSYSTFFELNHDAGVTITPAFCALMNQCLWCSKNHYFRNCCTMDTWCMAKTPSVSPGSTSIKMWRKALRKTFGLTLGVTEYRLGDWLHSNTSKWQWFFDPNTTYLYQRFGQIWRVWYKTSQGPLGRNTKFCYMSNALSIPSSAQRATVATHHNNKITLTGWCNQQEGDNSLHNMSIENELNYELLSIEGTLEEIAQFIQQNQAIGVSNGSFNKDFKSGSTAWVIGNESHQYRAIYGCITSGNPDNQNPY